MPRRALVAAFLLLAACEGRSTPTRPETANPDGNPKSAHLVPPPSSPSWIERTISNVAAIDHPGYVLGAMDLLLSLEDAPGLSTEDDRAIFALLKDYKSGAADLTIVFDAIPPEANGAMIAMAYICEEETYVVQLGMRMPLVQFAAILYHEAKHAADCRNLRTKRGIGPGELGPPLIPPGAAPCLIEYSAYAANVRVFPVLLAATGGTLYFSSQDDRPKTIIDNLLEVWPALYENRFCSWYREKLPHRR